MKAFAIVKSILQVVALTMVLLTWSSIGRVFEGLTAKSNSLLLWFGPPTPPKQIHVGEIYNVTIDFVASLATRKTFLNSSMTLGMTCSSGNPAGGSSYQFDNFLVKQKSGTRFVEYPMTAAELHPDAAGSLCHLTLAYTYWPNMAPMGDDTPIVPTSDEAASDVFKLVRAPRLRPLPLANATVLDPADRRLSLQLRVDDNLDSSFSARRLALVPPAYTHYYYTAVSMWPEDDPEWSLDDRASGWTVLRWLVFVAIAYTVRCSDRARAIIRAPWDRLVGWWGNDIEDPLAPRKTVRSRRRSILRDHIPMHGPGA